ncbi:cupredoxin family copper-binding protein [Pseudohalocynthiibacter aestuariivivens]|jgi:plastocyanin|uniref:Cupredoxin family copper-binding protein n=1 Tax=Pseudohalocynthiibacter aestuariivivens TaxID=1591409 RepID=A0ABV5JAE1_9RHOB|nr:MULTISPECIES: cupredoxin family copper-binding protein [Pseudohalocynthiibacter]MBS9716018.1 cupredoxin family copper-binding protein [Pseudohalocynthiibacter aestuariivivens]
MRQVSRRQILTNAMALPIALAVFSRQGRAHESSKLHEVDIVNFAFVPETISVHPGDRIVWTNRDLSPHTATAESGDWDTGELGQGQSAELAVTEDMVGSFFCTFHPNMKGQLVLS